MTKSSPTAFLSHFFKGVKIYLLFFTISLTAWQCVSPPDYLGGDLLPNQDIYRVKTDTSFVLSAYTEPYDSIVTAGFTNALVGETFDPIFGRTQASFLSQMQMSRLNQDWGTNPVIDSAYLQLQLADQYGNEPILVTVYELADSLELGVGYNGLASIDKWVGTTEIGASLLPYNGDESTLKIPIHTSWIQSKLIDAIVADTTIVDSQEDFLKHMPGIRVVARNTFSTFANGMYYFDYTNTASALTIYYSNDDQDEDATTSLTFSLRFGESSTARFNHIENDPSVADPDLAMNFNVSSAVQDSVFYVKGLGAARGVIVLDDLQKWVEKMPVAINRAELRIEREEHDAMPADTLLNRLFLFTMKDDTRENLVDRLVAEEDFGGDYSKSKKYYSFNITNHLQELLKNPDNDAIYVEPSNAYERAGGAVLRSGSHSSRMKLIITYTKL